MILKAGSTSVINYFAMRLAADGTAATGLTATNFDLYYTRSGAAISAKVDATLNGNGVAGAWSASTVVEVGKGIYRVDFVDAAFAAGVREVELTVECATAFIEHLRVELSPDVNIASIDADAINAASINTGAFTADAFAADALVAATFATGAFTADAFAADALVAATFATGAFTADAFAADALVAATFATGAFTADAFAADALVAATFATDSIAADALAADAVTEIQSGLSTAAKLLAYVQLLARADEAIENDNATELTAINADGGSGVGDYKNDTDALEALRNRGDVAWLTGGGGGATASYTTANWTRTIGDNDGGVAADTATVNGTYFATGEVNAGTFLEVDAIFTIGAGEVAQSVDLWGFYNGGGSHSIQVQALDTVSGLYEPLDPVIGLSTAVGKFRFALSPGHTNGTAVTIKFVHGAGPGNTSHVFNVDKCQVNTSAPVTSDGSGLTAIPWNAAWDTEVESECNDALVGQKLDHLVAVADADDPVNNSIVAKLAATGGDWSTFVPADDSLQAARDRLDTLVPQVIPFSLVGNVDVNVEEIDTSNAAATILRQFCLGAVALNTTTVAMTAAGVQDMFTRDSGTTYAGAVAGSVVKEIADNAVGAGGDATLANQVTIIADIAATTTTIVVP